MKFRLPIMLLSCAGMLTLSAAGHADGVAMNACIKAFTDSQLADRKVVAVHRDFAAPGPLLTRPKTLKIDLSARSVGGSQIASAVCVVTPAGEVISMSGKAATPATFAAR